MMSTKKTNLQQPVKQTYYALSDGRVAGQRVTAGQPIELTPEQAKYEPVSNAAPKTRKAAAKADADK